MLRISGNIGYQKTMRMYNVKRNSQQQRQNRRLPERSAKEEASESAQTKMAEQLRGKKIDVFA